MIRTTAHPFDSRRPFSGLSWVAVCVTLITLVLFFNPLATWLTKVTSASFAPTPYSSLSLSNTKLAHTGVHTGSTFSLDVENHTSSDQTYQWRADQFNVVIESGSVTVGPGQTSSFSVDATGALPGSLRVSLAGTSIYVTVPVTPRPTPPITTSTTQGGR